MRGIIVVCCICCMLLSATALRPSVSGSFSFIGSAIASANTDRTEIMQQSDHQRRVERAKEAEAEDRQIAAFGVPEAPTRSYDYIVLILLGASLLILALVAHRRRRAGFRL